MPRVFNTTAVCIPEKHYMVNLDSRLREIRQLVDEGKYFTINRARQYGKTTLLMALNQSLKNAYYTVSLDFQTFGSAEFRTEYTFAEAFAGAFAEGFEYNNPSIPGRLRDLADGLEEEHEEKKYTLRSLFRKLRSICAASDRPIVLMIDEVDSASNNQVFLDFLAQLRAQYITRFQQPAFQSVILAGVCDVKNLKQKIRPEGEHKYNSPWNIAADFKVDMSFSAADIAGMLEEYETDYNTGMDISMMSELLRDYTSGYPFLVSRLCQLMDEAVSIKAEYASKKAAWTKEGFNEAVRMLLSEKNTLFESLIGKLHDYPRLNTMLETVLFTGRTFLYNSDENTTDIASMFGFIKNRNGTVAVANRIFEMRLYNYYLSQSEMQETELYRTSLQDRSSIKRKSRVYMKL